MARMTISRRVLIRDLEEAVKKLDRLAHLDPEEVCRRLEAAAAELEAVLDDPAPRRTGRLH